MGSLVKSVPRRRVEPVETHANGNSVYIGDTPDRRMRASSLEVANFGELAEASSKSTSFGYDEGVSAKLEPAPELDDEVNLEFVPAVDEPVASEIHS